MEKDTDSSLTAQMKWVVKVDFESKYGNSELSDLLDIWILGLGRQSLITVLLRI